MFFLCLFFLVFVLWLIKISSLWVWWISLVGVLGFGLNSVFIFVFLLLLLVFFGSGSFLIIVCGVEVFCVVGWLLFDKYFFIFFNFVFFYIIFNDYYD